MTGERPQEDTTREDAAREDKAPSRRHRWWLSSSAACLLGACVQASPAPPPVEDVPFRVMAHYPATMVYAMDGAAGLGRHDEGYAEWLLGDVRAEPAWLADWRSIRETQLRQVDEGDGYFDPLLRASYQADDLAELGARWSALVDDDTLRALQRSVVRADRILRTRWAAMEPSLHRTANALERLLRSDASRSLVERLRTCCQLDASTSGTYHVVLVAKPPGPHTYAHHQGDHLVLEWHEERVPTSALGIVFHELAHLAVHRAPSRAALEQRFSDRGLAGTVAANHWNEAFATAFGNGLAAADLDPEHDPTQPLYADPAIDALARTLLDVWGGDGPTALTDLSDHLVQGVSSAWPSSQWRLRDVFDRLVLYADDEEARTQFVQSSAASWVTARTPIPSLQDERALGVPPTMARAYLVTRAMLDQRPALANALSLDTVAVYRQLARATSSARLDVDGQDRPRLVLVARDNEALREAVNSWQPGRPLPPLGWFTP